MTRQEKTSIFSNSPKALIKACFAGHGVEGAVGALDGGAGFDVEVFAEFVFEDGLNIIREDVLTGAEKTFDLGVALGYKLNNEGLGNLTEKIGQYAPREDC